MWVIYQRVAANLCNSAPSQFLVATKSRFVAFDPVPSPPDIAAKSKEEPVQPHRFFLVELVGIEPTTPCLQSRCSSQLSYSPSGSHDRSKTVGSAPAFRMLLGTVT